MVLKRFFDLTFSIMGLVILGPLLIFTSLLILLFDGFPIFFIQKRLTKNKKEFNIVKFRTMDINFDKQKSGIQIKGNSSAITSLGKILRKFKIDELPQLFNILTGDMSFVGPRPELPRRIKYYNNKLDNSFNFKSGITSPASIIFSDEEFIMEQVSDPEDFYIQNLLPLKARLNIYYIQNFSLLTDVKYILYTFFPKNLKKFIHNNIKDDDLIKGIKDVRNGKKLEISNIT